MLLTHKDSPAPKSHSFQTSQIRTFPWPQVHVASADGRFGVSWAEVAKWRAAEDFFSVPGKLGAL